MKTVLSYLKNPTSTSPPLALLHPPGAMGSSLPRPSRLARVSSHSGTAAQQQEQQESFTAVQPQQPRQLQQQRSGSRGGGGWTDTEIEAAPPQLPPCE